MDVFIYTGYEKYLFLYNGRLNPMSTIPTTPVLNQVMTQNGKTKRDAGITEKPIFSMAHPQKLSSDGLTDLLGTFDLNNPTKESNGLIRGNTLNPGGSYFVTPGVIKFNPGQTPSPMECCCTDNLNTYLA
jgi:hypothetical protein